MRIQRLTVVSLLLFLSTAALAPAWAAKDLKPKKTEITAFLKADANKDRVLSRKEFKTFVQVMAKFGQSTARQIRFFRAYGFAFKIVDKNKDGIVTPHEMRAADDDFRAGKMGKLKALSVRP